MRQATDESIVLLKNENNTLPLDRIKAQDHRRDRPVGRQVLLDWYSGTPPYTVSIAGRHQGSSRRQECKVLYADGSRRRRGRRAWRRRPTWRSWLSAIIPTCNAGWDQCPTPSNGKEDVDRKTIALEQEELVKQVFAANPHTVEVLRSSFPYAIVWSQQNLPAIVHMTHNSQEEGHGLADVLFGDYSPAGRLSQTWPTGDDNCCPSWTTTCPWPDVSVFEGEAALCVWLRAQLHDLRV